MARVTRSTKLAAQTEAAVTTPKKHTADIPIRSIEKHDAPSKEADKKRAKKIGSQKSKDRQKEYKKKRRQRLIGDINASGKPYTERDALKAEIYKRFKPKSAHSKKVMELEQLAEAQRQEIAELQKQLDDKQSTEIGTPKTTGGRRARRGFA